MLLALGICTLVLVTSVLAQLPENVQLLNGYHFEFPEQTNLQLSYIENENDDEPPNGPFLNLRSKRGYQYRVLESNGLRSHFKNSDEPSKMLRISKNHPVHIDNNQEYMQNIAYTGLHPPPEQQSRPKREIQIEDVKKPEAEVEEEILPVAEKQYSEQDFGKQSRSLSSFMTDYPKPSADDDTLSDASNNEGIKTRAPRVHFVTQQKKSIEAAEARDRPTITKPFEYYRSNELYDGRSPKYYDDYVPSNNRRYDLYPRKYDRIDRELNYYPRYDSVHYRKRYEDDYVPRNPSSFYMYPNGPYDLPEPRDVYSYTNEIDRMAPPPHVPYHTGFQSSSNNRRIIYYATLPEVVRSPPNVDLRYRSHFQDRSYDALYPNNYYNGDRYRSHRSPRYFPQNQPPSSLTSSATSSLTEIKDPVKSAPVRISSNLKVKDQSRNAPMEPRHFTESSNASGAGSGSNGQQNNPSNSRPISDHSHSSLQDGIDERDQTYFSRNH